MGENGIFLFRLKCRTERTMRMNFFLNVMNQAATAPVVEEVADQAEQSIMEIFTEAGQVVLIGLVVVIGTLLVLTGIFYLFGFIMDSLAKGSAKAKNKKKAETPAVAPAPSAPAIAPPVVQEGISGEVVAAIAAAVAMMAPEGKRYALKSVSRKDANGRSAWAAAGIADNTRPF